MPDTPKDTLDLNWKLPLKTDGMGIYILGADGDVVAQIRGWGSLTGSGGKMLLEELAVEIQKARAQFIVDAVNSATTPPKHVKRPEFYATEDE